LQSSATSTQPGFLSRVACTVWTRKSRPEPQATQEVHTAELLHGGVSVWVGREIFFMLSGKRKAAPAVSAQQGGTLVVWDFDWSLINENSDTYVIEQLDKAVEEKMNKKARNGRIGWTQLMDWAVGELHAAGHTPQQMRDALVRVPILKGALMALDAAEAAGATQRILSDANTVYIASILEGRGLASKISKVVTNPARHDDATGRLRIKPHQPSELPHGCDDCPANLCKGAVLDAWLQELSPARVIYVGDGGGDFCPATRLREGCDTLLARRPPHDGLLRACRRFPERVRCKVVEWGDGGCDTDGLSLAEAMREALGMGAADEVAPGGPS
jgi:pyridoxal phosphate phosphatase PHOSPHO2